MGTPNGAGGLSRKGPFIPALGISLAMATLVGSAAQAKPWVQAWSLSIPYASPSQRAVEDTGRSGLLLLDRGSDFAVAAGSYGKYVPDLALRTAEGGRIISRRRLLSWLSFKAARQGRLYDDPEPTFRFVCPPGTLLMVQVPWLALVDLRTGSIIRSLLPSPDLSDSHSRAPHVLSNPLPMAVAVLADGRAVAVASNVGDRPRLFVYNSDLTRCMAVRSLPRYATGLAWSPHGKRVAVLYDGKFNGKRDFVGEFPKLMPVRLPDVAIFDADAGRQIMTFFTGGPESEIAFSPGGSLIYVISQESNVTSLQQDAVRAFDSHTGKLVRTLAPKGPPVHDEFAISPDGQVIAANASTGLWHPFFTEAPAFGDVSRVELFDAKTGRVIFSRSARTSADLGLNPVFSPDGRLLIVQFAPGRSARQRRAGMLHIVAYPLAPLRSGRRAKRR
jgi:hypothetical protein